MKTLTLLNVNGIYFFNGDKITYQRYVELLNTTFIYDKCLFSLQDTQNNVIIRVRGI